MKVLEREILVIGAGPAGLCAAIAARRAGADQGLKRLQACLKKSRRYLILQSVPRHSPNRSEGR